MGKQVTWVRVNGEEPTNGVTFDNHKIKLDSSILKNGKNEVEIRFVNDYHNDGVGLHYFKDPEDGEEYLYTQFEAFNAHKCFPCFDQPDLKA